MSKIIELLEKTPEHQGGVIDFATTEKGVAVWSVDSTTGAFFTPQLASAFKLLGYGAFCHYNIIEKRVELQIFEYGN